MLTLTFSPLMTWYSGLTALFPFLSAKVALAYLPTALSVAPRPLFPFQQAQYVQIFLLKPVPFCTLFAGFGSMNKSAISFLLSGSRSVLATLCVLRLSFYLKLSGRSSRNCLLCPVLLDYNWSPDTSFSRRMTAYELARWGVLLVPSAIFCSFSLICRVLSYLFLDWRRTVSSKFFDLQVSLISTKELVLPRHARCVLSRLCCNGHSHFLGSYLSRTGRIENSSSSACNHLSQDTFHLILHCPAMDSLHRTLFGDSLSLHDLWSRP